MIQKLIREMRRALGLHAPGRNLDVWPDDKFIISYPKSGNTWTGFLIANLAYPDTPADFANINRLTPDPERIRKAVTRGAADEMRRMEKSQALLWSSTKDARQDVPFVRTAKAGDWRTDLSDAAGAHLEASWGHLMTYLGYELRFPGNTPSFESRFVEALLSEPAR